VTPHLGVFELKVWAAATGFTTGLAGMALERRWLVLTGVALLGLAFLLRFADRSRQDP
jgi:hypothetical protein